MDPSGFLLRADTLPLLLDKIALYRRNNGFTPGNPAAEVEAIYRRDYPWLVSKVGLVELKGDDPVAKWLERAWRMPMEMAEHDTADKRTLVCLNCEFHRPAHVFSADANRRITILGKGKYKPMGACAAHHWPVGLAVCILKPDVTKEVPGCWAT